jgi:hypothetical protein
VARSAGEGPRLVGGRYELEALIGRGGIGEVWRARHVALDSHVAIKLLQLSAGDGDVARRRFTAEARITAQLKSPNAVQVFDFGLTDEGQPYLVMELLDGETLGQRLTRVKRLGADETVRLLGQVARALQRAHQLGIVHRDLKPDNLIVCKDDEGRDRVKVLDFGLAKLVGALDVPAGDRRPPGAASLGAFTRTGTVLGTPLYMAPEQVRAAADVDARADVWALGVVAFQCLTGHVPFVGGTLDELFERIQGGVHRRASFLEPSVPPEFDAWFDQACALEPARRFADADTAFRRLAASLRARAQAPGSPATALGDAAPVVVVPAAERADVHAPTLAVAPVAAVAPTAPAARAARAEAVAAAPRSAPRRERTPLVRARHLKDWLAHAERDEDPWRARFFAAIPRTTREAIESATGGSWLPLELHVQLADVMQDAYGPARAHEHYRGAFADSLRGGIIGPLVRTGTRLFGLTPASFLRWAHRGWQASFRDAGALSTEVLGPGRGRVVYEDLVAICTASDAWLGSAQGSAYGMLDVCEVTGVVRLDMRARAQGRMELVLEWTERR